MEIYYYDDSSVVEHFARREFSNDSEALEWGEALNEIYKENSATMMENSEP